MVDVAELEQLSEDELDEFASHMHAAMTFAQQGLLAALALKHRRGSFRADGAPAMENWVVARFGELHAMARAWVKAADDLATAPAVAHALSNGEISFSQARYVAELS